MKAIHRFMEGRYRFLEQNGEKPTVCCMSDFRLAELCGELSASFPESSLRDSGQKGVVIDGIRIYSYRVGIGPDEMVFGKEPCETDVTGHVSDKQGREKGKT